MSFDSIHEIFTKDLKEVPGIQVFFYAKILAKTITIAKFFAKIWFFVLSKKSKMVDNPQKSTHIDNI